MTEGSSVDLASLEKLGEGYEAEIFAWEDGQALRLFREGYEGNVEPERIAIAAALAGGIPAPRLGEALRLGGRAGTLMERIDGENLLDLVGRKPWLLARESGETGKIHARLNALPAPAGIATVHERAREWVGNVEIPPHLAALARETLKGLEGGDRFCHGDFHAGNVLLERGGRRVVIDWGSCTAGPAEADVARTVTVVRLGEPLDASPALRVITRLFRPLAAFAYLRGYQLTGPVDTNLMWRWVVVRAIEHLAILRAIRPPDEDVPSRVAAVERLVALAQKRAGR